MDKNNTLLVQSLIELNNNLAHEQQNEAWLELSAQDHQRQRTAAQLIQSMENATVLLAVTQNSAYANSKNINNNNQFLASSSSSSVNYQQQDFHKVMPNVYVTIKSVPIQSTTINNNQSPDQNQNQNQLMTTSSGGQLVQLHFPSDIHLFGYRDWMNHDQEFTLQLEAVASNQPTSPPTVNHGR